MGLVNKPLAGGLAADKGGDQNAGDGFAHALALLRQSQLILTWELEPVNDHTPGFGVNDCRSQVLLLMVLFLRSRGRCSQFNVGVGAAEFITSVTIVADFLEQ